MRSYKFHSFIHSFLFFNQYLAFAKNQYIWDVSALSVTSPVVTMILYDGKGQEIPVVDLQQPIRIEIATGAADAEPALVKPYLAHDAPLYIHAIQPNWNSTQALSIVLTPDSTNETFEVFLKHGSIPTPTDFEMYYLLPDDDAGSEGREGFEYKIFIQNETITANETDVLYLGLRMYGKSM